MKRGLKRILLPSLILLALLGAYVSWAIYRPLTPITASLNSSLLSPQLTPSKLIWPAQGQSAVGIVGKQILDSHNPQTAVPTASTAKMITTLMILKLKPLSPGEQGPIITLTSSDVAIYNNYVAQQGSVVPVLAGEQISEYQMLEAMLLPSANNMADSLAIWAYGSLAAYAKVANVYLASQGLTSTTIGSDASGFSPTTKSSADNLVRIGEMVMQNPVLAQIVSQTSASGIPIVSTVKNVNYLLGTNNIVGIKTGNTNQAGGVYVSAAKVVIDKVPLTIVTANVGATTLGQAVSGSLPFIDSAEHNFDNVTLAKSGLAIASYKLPWDNIEVNAVNSNTVNAEVWGGSYAGLTDSKISDATYPSDSNKNVGEISASGSGVIDSSSSSLVLQNSFSKPSIQWRLIHPKV